jgi:shikimate kinase
MIFYLLGFMGSGKSTQGRQAARRCGIQFLDLDDWIEARHQMRIPDVFNHHGEEVFRMMERDALREVSMAQSHLLISAGGGTPCYHGNMEFMNEEGLTIWLDISAARIASRLEFSKRPRPMLPADRSEWPAYVAAKLEERRPFYEKAQVHLEEERADANGIEEVIRAALKGS